MRCLIIDDDSVSRKMVADYIARTDFLYLMAEFEDSIAAVNYLQNHSDVDLIFLDVRMPGMDGFEFLELLENTPQVVMMSVSPDYALEAFEVGATDYLLKPINYARFFRSVSKALRWMNPSNPEEGELYIKKNATLVRIPYTEIFWIESMENYVNVHTLRERFTLHFTLKVIAGHMPPTMFRRIHRSYIVNLGYIAMIDGNTLTLQYNGQIKLLPIGKSYKDQLMSTLRLIGQPR